MKSRSLTWAGFALCVGKVRNVHVSVRKRERKRSLGKLRGKKRRTEEIIKLHLT
jgi:hypothetical protein